jgi:hypothetical protein
MKMLAALCLPISGPPGSPYEARVPKLRTERSGADMTTFQRNVIAVGALAIAYEAFFGPVNVTRGGLDWATPVLHILGIAVLTAVVAFLFPHRSKEIRLMDDVAHNLDTLADVAKDVVVQAEVGQIKVGPIHVGDELKRQASRLRKQGED